LFLLIICYFVIYKVLIEWFGVAGLKKGFEDLLENIVKKRWRILDAKF